MSVRTSVSSQRTPMIKVRAVVKKEELKDCAIMILIGPTGGGKSNFIEKLASQEPGETNIAGISDHKLTPGTADVVAYRMDHQFLDLWTNKPIIFVDTPGLCDKDKSDAQTKSQIQKWMKKNAVKTVDRLLYVDRISDNRAPRSKSKTIEVLESLCGKETPRRTVVMTAMWDLMWNERLKSLANHRYNLLKNGYWKDFLGQGCQIGTFDNTFDAAWGILKMFGAPEMLQQQYSTLDFTLQIIDAALGNQSVMTTSPHLTASLIKGKAKIIEDMRALSNQNIDFDALSNDEGWLSKLKELGGTQKPALHQGPITWDSGQAREIIPMISTAVLIPCSERPELNFHRRQAMTMQRQIIEEKNWLSIFADSSNHLSVITLNEIRPEDVVILLLGHTGTGRSTFISMFDTQNRQWVNDMIDTNMESKTRDVNPVRVSIPNAHCGLVLLDTPGFNSGDRKDMETLKIISDALKDRPGRCIRVNGVIYFDPIERANEKFYKKLLEIALNICGKDNYDRMAFLSTNWDAVGSRAEGEQNEKDLTEGAWKNVLTCNSSTADLTRVGRFILDGGKDAVRKLTWALVREPHVRVWLKLQVELSQGIEVEETQAGKGI